MHAAASSLKSYLAIYMPSRINKEKTIGLRLIVYTPKVWIIVMWSFNMGGIVCSVKVESSNLGIV